ncbi:DUF3450 domain-containing protein [Staphylococcus nepalensis]|uniref:DUF3450 domain-containing protein n=1 Tax=Staphylococcus nepalensis TaxID=214473 RepID=UPI001C3FC07C|nr:DUF3450 domain-containing protein [Staphylococcus nepalensis]
MNELSIEVKAQEIHENAQFWHNRAEHNLYKFFLEVKKIRDNRYYKELGYSNFEDYCLNSWNIKRGTMDERIQIAETFSESDFNRYSGQLGHKKTLLLTTMSEPQREQTLNEGVPTEQGYKSYEKATQKEIAAYKRSSEEMERKAKEYEQKLKQRDEQNAQLQSQVEQAQRSEEIARKQLEEAEDREPEVVEREIVKEVVPERINKQLENLKNDKKLLEQREKELSDLKQKFKNNQNNSQGEKYRRDENLKEEEQIASIRFQVETNLLALRDDANEFLEKVSHTPYREAAIARASDRTKNMMFDVVEEIEAWTRQMRNTLNTSQIIEGD